MDFIIKDILLALADLGYWGIALGLMIEVIPSEIVLSYGGYLVSIGKLSFSGALLAGIVGEPLRKSSFTGLDITGEGPSLRNMDAFY